MDFKFIHASDLHLGSPFIGLSLKDEDVAKRFAAASRDAFADLVTRAIDLKVAFVIIAGDVYDGEWKDTSIGLFFNRELARLNRVGIPVFLLRGNHDAESVVTKTISLPDCVHQFPSNKPKTFRIEELEVAIHGRSFADRAVSENFVLSYPDPVPGWLNIGVLHTSCEGRPGHAVYAPCTAADLVCRGYQYWALGHVHEYEELACDPWIVFPGNLQGRSVRELGPKGAVIVDVAGDRIIGVERLILDRARWAAITINLAGTEDEANALRKIEEAIRPVAEEADGRLLALRVRVEGMTRLHRMFKRDPHRFSDEVQAAAQREGGDIWLERLHIETSDVEELSSPADVLSSIDVSRMLDELIDDPTVRVLAAELVSAVNGKLPGGITDDEVPASENLNSLLRDARAIVLGRTTQ